MVLERTEESGQSLTNPSAAGEADDRSHADINIPHVQKVGDEWWGNLGQDGIDNHLKTGRSGGVDSFDRAEFDIFDRFRKQFTDQCKCCNCQGQHSCEWTNPDPKDKNDHIQQGFDRAQKIKHAPGQVIDPDGERAATGQVLGSQETERQGNDGSQRGCEQCLEDRDDQLLDRRIQNTWG